MGSYIEEILIPLVAIIMVFGNILWFGHAANSVNKDDGGPCKYEAIIDYWPTNVAGCELFRKRFKE